VTNSDEEEEDDEYDEEDEDDEFDSPSEPVYGAPQRVCDSCFFCCILAPMVAWAHGHPVDGFVPSSELDQAIERIRGITSLEGVADYLKENSTEDCDDDQMEVPMPHQQVLMRWARVLLVLDNGLATLRQEAVVATGTVKESLFWWRYFRRVFNELNDDDASDWDDEENWGDDEEDDESDSEDGEDYQAAGRGPGHPVHTDTMRPARPQDVAAARADVKHAQHAQQRLRAQQGALDV
jgi:hypothetical protein